MAPRPTRSDADETAADIPQIFGGEAPEAEDAETPWTEDEIGAMLKLEIDDAASYVETELGPDRAEATRRYKGEPYGDETDGRSQIVSRDLRDTVMQILPSLLRIFAGPKRVVEFEPERPDAEELAQERTDFVNHVFTRDNPGFRILFDAFKDALVRRYAIFKWWWEDKTEVEVEIYNGQTEEQVAEMANDPTVSNLSFEEDGTIELPPDEDDLAGDPTLPTPAGDPATPVSPTSRKTYKVQIRRERPANRACVAILPGEEFLIDRNATGIHDAVLVAHRRGITRSDLVAMGYTPEYIAEHEGSGAFSFDYAEEAQARRGDRTQRDLEVNADPDLARVAYTEAWRRIDRDGDSIAELYKVCLIGDDGHVGRIEPAVDIPFAVMSPDPEPHEFAGQGYFDILEDLQRINTVITRLTLDSFALSVTPRLAVDERRVNMMDVLNTEIGAIVRTEGIDAIQNLETPFTGAAGLQMLEYFRGVREERGGVTRTSQGLDADALQSTTKAAVSAQISAAQARIELLARIFAETGLKPMFAGLQRLLMRHQDVPRTVRLRGKWVTADPRSWNAALDVRVNVGLGAGPVEDRIGRLAAIAEKQELIYQTLGPGNPLVGLEHYRNTVAKMVEASGEDPDSFFGKVPPGYQPPPPANTSDPAMLLAEAQAKEIEAKLMIEQARLAQDREEMLLKAELEREKLAQDQVLKIKELELKHMVDLKELEIKREIDQAKVQASASAAAARGTA